MAENFDKLMSIFQEALEKHSPESQDEFVLKASEGDEELYRPRHAVEVVERLTDLEIATFGERSIA